ncbi:unnamed protein product [Pleuronectes platessa]|uniref:Uncharacterized protein n=1 Tax=Pleuronectes platessa TaxID=8262 RepID=A0A9N7TKE5_PLEPL|nr:unnamed protein product [Pleuronectes platessa]
MIQRLLQSFELLSSETSNSTSLDGAWLCDGRHRRSPDATTTPEIDGQLKTERRRLLRRVICEELLKHAKENLVYICQERESERGRSPFSLSEHF